MQSGVLDPYRPRPSVIHRLDPRVKFVLAVAFVLATALTPSGAWPVYVLLFSLILAVEVLSELGVGYLFGRTLLALPFVLAALPLLLTTEGTAVFEVSHGAWALTVTREGLTRFLSIAFKSWISVHAAVVLTASTPFPALLMAMRSVGIPRLLVAIVGLMWRYLFVLMAEATRLLHAREARSAYPVNPRGRVGGSLVWRAGVTGGMVGSLFLRALERADRIYAAMASRGYDGEVRVLPLPPIPPIQRRVLGGGLVFLALLGGLGWLLWG